MFNATGIEKSERIITPIYSPESYGGVDRKKALADNEHYINNQAAIMSANSGGKVKITYTDDNGHTIERPFYDGLKHCIEPDYKQK